MADVFGWRRRKAGGAWFSVMLFDHGGSVAAMMYGGGVAI